MAKKKLTDKELVKKDLAENTVEEPANSKQIPLEEAAIFNMAIQLREAIKKEPATDKAEFYHQTLDKGGVMSRLDTLRKNPGMSKDKVAEFDKLIAEIKELIDSKLGDYKPGSDKKKEAVKQAPAKPAAPITPPPPPPAAGEDAKLKKFAGLVEKYLVEHTARLPMTKLAAFDWIKKSGKQYTVTINPDIQDPDKSVITISLGPLTENLQPIKLH